MAINIQEKQVLIDGLKVNYKQIGDGNIPIILLHGWGINSDKYLETAKYLSESQISNLKSQKYCIYLLDLPGFGKSDNPQKAWEVDDYTEWLKNYAMAINLSSFILIGHSFGGRIAIKFAAKYPEKLKALILTGAAGIKHPLSAKQRLFYALAKGGKIIFSLPLINYLQNSAQKLLYRAAQEKDYYQVQGIMKEIFKKVIDEDLTPCLEKISAFGGSARLAGALAKRAGGGKTPTLLIWGANDRLTPLRDAYIMKEKISAHSGPATGGENCKLKIIGNADHRLPYQHPREFAKIVLDFIKNTNA